MKISLLIFFTVLIIGCDKSSKDAAPISIIKEENLTAPSKRIYGQSLNNEIVIQSFQNATLYMPKIIKSNEKLPLVLFAPGWSSQDHSNYKTLLTFIASQGYAAIYARSPMEYSANLTISRFATVLNDNLVSQYFDKSKLGVIGHSSGGGISFKVMDYFSKNGYGNAGRFIFSMDPWFAFDMSKEDFEDFPKNTNIVIQQYINGTQTDPRIALTIFDQLSALGDENRDYQVYLDLNHGYPSARSYDAMQIILRPLDALMDYTFFENQNAYKSALDIGSDAPYIDNLQPIESSDAYDYRCNSDNNDLISALKGLNYCSIAP